MLYPAKDVLCVSTLTCIMLMSCPSLIQFLGSPLGNVTTEEAIIIIWGEPCWPPPEGGPRPTMKGTQKLLWTIVTL